MLIKSPKARQERAERNRRMLWEFLKIHTYSDLETLANHIDVKTKPVVSRILKEWVFDGWVKKVQVKNKFGSCWLFGVTTKALEGDTTRRAFQPSKVNLRTLEHTLKCQRASSYFLKHEAVTDRGYKLVNIESGDLKKYGMKHRPDLIIQNQETSLVGLICIEVELSLKSKQRYDEILKNYLTSIERSKVNQVIYVFYDEKIKLKFEQSILRPFFSKRVVEKKHQEKFFSKLFQ
jgi:hypothetical protein